jgi:predicted transcriptional regulator
MSLAQLFVEGRRALGWNQAELAREASRLAPDRVYQSFICEVESGKRPNPRWNHTSACLRALGLLALTPPGLQGEAK